MITQLTEEIDSVIASTTPKKPIYRLQLNESWRGSGVSFKCTNQTESSSESFIKSEVMGHISTKVNFANGTSSITANNDNPC